jgi:hypothetical protein
MRPNAECYISGEHSSPFLRVETPRERIALPYATLLGFTLSVDETILELDFASHKITVKGERLHEVFCALARGLGQALLARNETELLLQGPNPKAPFIREIRIKNSAPAED